MGEIRFKASMSERAADCFTTAIPASIAALTASAPDIIAEGTGGFAPMAALSALTFASTAARALAIDAPSR